MIGWIVECLVHLQAFLPEIPYLPYIPHTTHPGQHRIHRRVTNGPLSEFRRSSLKVSGDDRGWQFVAKESEKPVSLSASRVECAKS